MTDELVPTEVDKEPAAMELTNVPPTTDVTTTVSVQLPPGAIRVPKDKVTVEPPAFARAVPRLQLVKGFGTDALTMPAGYISVNSAVSVAVTNALVFTIDSVKSDVPPPMMDVGLNDFEIVGGDVATGSLSEDWHPVAVHPTPKFVLTTPPGTVMTAVFVTRDCAPENPEVSNKRSKNAKASAR